MGDDYDTLCRDVLHELGELLSEDGKAAKKLRNLERIYGRWKAREVSIKEYRATSGR